MHLHKICTSKSIAKLGHKNPWQMWGKYKAHPLRSAPRTPEAYFWGCTFQKGFGV